MCLIAGEIQRGTQSQNRAAGSHGHVSKPHVAPLDFGLAAEPSIQSRQTHCDRLHVLGFALVVSFG